MDDVSSLQVASRLLKDRGVRYSAPTWALLKTDRLEPALESKALTRDDVRDMLQDMEGHGKAHVLLFRPTVGVRVNHLLKRARVCAALDRLGLTETLDAPPPPKAPVSTKVTHVGFEADGALVVKALETKESFSQVDDFKLPGGREVRLAQRARARRVKLARLHTNGLLEVRLGSTRLDPNERNDHTYSAEAHSFLKLIGGLIPPGDFDLAPLDTFKSMLWTRSRRGLEERILVLSQDMASDRGNVMALRAGSRAMDASQDDTLRIASQAFLQQKGSSMAQAKILWVAQGEPDLPRVDITVRMTSEAHEFYTSKATCKTDYERVFLDIRRLGKL